MNELKEENERWSNQGLKEERKKIGNSDRKFFQAKNHRFRKIWEKKIFRFRTPGPITIPVCRIKSINPKTFDFVLTETDLPSDPSSAPSKLNPTPETKRAKASQYLSRKQKYSTFPVIENTRPVRTGIRAACSLWANSIVVSKIIIIS